MYCRYPVSNRVLAEKTIRELGPRHLNVPLMVKKNRFTPERLDTTRFVNAFMRKFPRGNGLGLVGNGDDDLHQLYAACHTLKIRSSRKRYYSDNYQDGKYLGDIIRDLPISDHETILDMVADQWSDILPLNEDYFRYGIVAKSRDPNNPVMALTDRGIMYQRYLRKLSDDKLLRKAQKKIVKENLAPDHAVIKIGRNTTIRVDCPHDGQRSEIMKIINTALRDNAVMVTKS